MRVRCVMAVVAMVLLASGCSETSENHAVTKSERVLTATKNGDHVDSQGVDTLVVFVGGPADGETRYISLSELTGGTVVSGTRYVASQSIPPEVVNTAEGGAEVMRPAK